MIDQFIADAARRTGLEIETVRRVTGRLLSTAGANLGADRIARIVEPVPGARAVMDSGDTARHDLTATGGDLAGAATGRFGARAGIPWIADQTSVEEERVIEIARDLFDFFERNAGAGAAAELRSALPAAENTAPDEGGPHVRSRAIS
jgi:hypothetical protein